MTYCYTTVLKGLWRAVTTRSSISVVYMSIGNPESSRKLLFLVISGQLVYKRYCCTPREPSSQMFGLHAFEQSRNLLLIR